MLIKIEDTLKDGSTCIVQYNPGSLNDKIAKDGKIGFRIPNHDYLKSVLTKYQKPITTTSINKTGSVPLYVPDEIEDKFGDKIDLLIDYEAYNIDKIRIKKLYQSIESEFSFLETQETYMHAASEAGLDLVSIYDHSEMAKSFFNEPPSNPPAVNLGHLMGTEMPKMFANAREAVNAGIMSPIILTFKV